MYIRNESNDPLHTFFLHNFSPQCFMHTITFQCKCNSNEIFCFMFMYLFMFHISSYSPFITSFLEIDVEAPAYLSTPGYVPGCDY